MFSSWWEWSRSACLSEPRSCTSRLLKNLGVRILTPVSITLNNTLHNTTNNNSSSNNKGNHTEPSLPN